MKVNVVKKTSNEFKIEIEGAGHTICNLLQKKILEEKGVDLAGYDIPHPMTNMAVITVRTKEGTKADQAFRAALGTTRAMNKEFGKELARALKEKLPSSSLSPAVS
jgi:DNA-directed RNA polymerase subunit L